MTPSFERNPGMPLELGWVEDATVNRPATERRAATLTKRRSVKKDWQAAWLLKAVTCTDLTTLAGDDTPGKVYRLVAKAKQPVRQDLLQALGMSNERVTVAAVCVYHARVRDAVAALKGTDIPVAAVSTGFPAGQSPFEQRVAEIEQSVEAGAREIDIVISREHVLTGNWQALYDEIKQFRSACGEAHMKSILGTGDLATLTQVYQDLKFRVLDLVHEYLGRRGKDTNRLQPDSIRTEVSHALSAAISGAGVALNSSEREQLLEDVIHEITGFGPLQPLLLDDTVDDIIVNGYRKVYVERKGVLERVDTCFRDDQHLLNIIHRIVGPLGRRVDESSPFVDARLPDGSRVNVAIPPVVIDGPSISIRKFKRIPLTVQDLVQTQTLSQQLADYLAESVKARRNILVCGGTGSGKTTLLNILSSFIGPSERVITIEDAAELQLNQAHVVTLESRPPNLEGHGEITIRDLLRNALHMRPDRIIVGECRSGEALDMIQAMTVGQEGSLSTGHANSPPDMLRRLETMAMMNEIEMPLKALRSQVASAIQIIIQTSRFNDGSRKLTHIVEALGLDELGEYKIYPLFEFRQRGNDPRTGKVLGTMEATGNLPTFLNEIRERGMHFDEAWFRPPRN